MGAEQPKGSSRRNPASHSRESRESREGKDKDAKEKKNAPVMIGEDRAVMGRYRMHMGKDDVMGEGTSSICRKGTANTGQPVAIKFYKERKSSKGDATLQKFERQISVLKELQEPFQQPSDPRLWCEQLSLVKPSRVFMQLLDYSTTADGNPGPDPSDGILYVVTELAQYSLKDFLAQRREQGKLLSRESVQNISKAIILAMAGLHAKGFVHLDMKPENLMMFNGRLKVIDVDGCVRAGTQVDISDSSISFSPCYCAPEWARFLINENEATVTADACLDSWSVGMTLCELVSLDAILKPMYANFLKNAHSHREAGFLFMDWLAGLKKAPLPKRLEKADVQFLKLLKDGLLLCSASQRKTCAQCLSSAWLASKEKPTPAAQEEMAAEVARVPRVRNVEDDTSALPLHKGVLWKLNSGGNPKDAAHWIRRDMWIAHNHSLCYFSLKENNRLVLIDGAKLATALIEPTTGAAREFSFKVMTGEEEEQETYSFAAESEDEFKTWLQQLKMTGRMELLVTMKLGKQMQEDLAAFRIGVKNRRLKVEEGDQAEFIPCFKARLWKVKGEGDRMRESDWFLREMWVAKNGCLVYHSPKEERDLIYYTQNDLTRASLIPLANDETIKPWAFQIQLPPANGVEFAPGEFAAESEELRDRWLSELRRFM